MKSIGVVCIFLSAAFACGAQIEGGIPAYASIDNSLISPMFLRQTSSRLASQSGTVTVPPGFRMKKTGRALTFIGCFLAAGGVLVAKAADNTEGYNPSTGATTVKDPQLVLGSTMIAVGMGMTIPGVILWVNGSTKYKKYLDSKKPVASIQLKRNGLSLNYRF